MLPTQAHVKIGVARAKPSVTAGPDWTLVGGVIVAVDLAACQQVEWMATVVSENRSQLKAGSEWIFPRTFNYASHHDFVTLIEFRKSAVGAQVGRILRAIIAVKISTRVEAFAKRVVAEQSEVITEAPFDFEYSCLVHAGTGGSVLIVLHDKRVHKASEGIGARRDSQWELRAAQRVWVARTCARIPVPVGGSLPVCQRKGAKWRWQQIGVNGGGEADSMRVDVAGRDRKSRRNLALNSKLGLL